MGRLITLDEFILKSQNRFPGAKGDLSQLLRDISLACKMISREVNRAGLARVLGAAGESNVHGEAVKKLDLIANDLLIGTLSRSGTVCMIVSEENESVIRLPRTSATYIVFMDPLDGSSNTDVNGSIGTIFSIYQRRSHPADEPGETDLLRTGREQVAAGYVLYGTDTKLIYTTGLGVSEFTLEPGIGEFFLAQEDVRIPRQGSVYSANEGNRMEWPTPLQDFWRHSRDVPAKSSRYIGSMVSDVHRTLHIGGLFLYPESTGKPRGKLRLMYEANPMAFLVEPAGGGASDGTIPILDVAAGGIHDRCPVYLGSPDDMASLISYLRTR
jgi:fructose-1,6-bisphosphatase I